MTRTRAPGSSRHALDTCTLQLKSWNPFHPNPDTAPKVFTKKPCRTDRSTAPILPDSLDFSALSLIDDASLTHSRYRDEGIGWLARKRRRRRGSRSISGRSSDRIGIGSGTYATCSDFPILAGTDSSGELFLNGDANWGSDVSDVRPSRREGKDLGSGCLMDRDIFHGVHDFQWNDPGYGSETGYRGDAEFGYGEEIDEEEEDGRLIFWGDRSGGM